MPGELALSLVFARGRLVSRHHVGPPVGFVDGDGHLEHLLRSVFVGEGSRKLDGEVLFGGAQPLGVALFDFNLGGRILAWYLRWWGGGAPLTNREIDDDRDGDAEDR